MRRLFHYLLLLTLTTLAQANPCDATRKNPCLVFDTENNSAQIKNYRDTQHILHSDATNKLGLNNLWMSGSAIPSQEAWLEIYRRIQTTAQVEHIIDVDLQQETHGYVNNDAMNLTTENNWINLGKTYPQVLIAETQWLHNLKLNHYLENVLSHTQFKNKEFKKGHGISIQHKLSEKALVENIGFEYFRLVVTDHMPPTNHEVKRFVEFVKNLLPQTWLHFHCRGGDGRTTTFMAMYDMLNNADKVSFDDIIQRQAAVEPFYDLSEITRKNSKYNFYYQKRLEFLQRFYVFAQEYLQDKNKSWPI